MIVLANCHVGVLSTIEEKQNREKQTNKRQERSREAKSPFLSGVRFSKQGHVCRLEVPCVCSDLVVWLSSGVLGHPAKYFANVRYVISFCAIL